MKKVSAVRSVATRAAVTGLVSAGAIAFAAMPAFATAQTGSAAGMTFDLGPSPVGLPETCTFPNSDANFLFLSGSGVMHDSENKNGDWSGSTMQGPAVFYEDSTAVAQGHLTIWEGGGNNANGQNEGGLTLNFNGTGPYGTVQIHVNGHVTTNAIGQQTAHPVNVNVSCG